MSATGNLVILTGIAVMLADLAWNRMRITLATIAAEVLLTAGWLLDNAPSVAAVFALLAAASAWAWWDRNRRNRKRAAEAIGNKSRAIRDAIARKAREVTRPSPVLRPSLGGAR